MTSATFDSLQFVRILRDKGKFTTEQAESIADAVTTTLHDDLATKGDIQSVKSDLRETELRLEAKIADVRSDILKWMFGTIGFQTVVILSAVIALSHLTHP
jgi:hypothetical protein